MALVIRNENFVDWMQYWPAGEPVVVQRVATPERGAGRGGGGVPRDYRSLWRTAIRQTVLLGRMERENARRDRAEEERAERRLKLGYTELGGGPGWEAALAGPGEELQLAVGRGVPQARRGEAWPVLAARTPAPAELATQFPALATPYRQLKAQLTSHQHAILIDLGRTFPKHPYFAGALGPGQCAMFNILKAYSILDTEVGYCQGLPFCVGILLMHCGEEEAFLLLQHLMVTLGLRKQFHPNMSGLQEALYQVNINT